MGKSCFIWKSSEISITNRHLVAEAEGMKKTCKLLGKEHPRRENHVAELCLACWRNSKDCVGGTAISKSKGINGLEQWSSNLAVELKKKMGPLVETVT